MLSGLHDGGWLVRQKVPPDGWDRGLYGARQIGAVTRKHIGMEVIDANEINPQIACAFARQLARSQRDVFVAQHANPQSRKLGQPAVDPE